MTLLLMPLLYEGFAALLAPHLAWRVAFFIPGGLQLMVGMWVLVGTDDTPADTFTVFDRCVQPNKSAHGLISYMSRLCRGRLQPNRRSVLRVASSSQVNWCSLEVDVPSW